MKTEQRPQISDEAIEREIADPWDSNSEKLALALLDERAETKRLWERNLLMHAVVLAARVYCDPECEDDTSYVCLLNAVKEYEALDSKALDGDATANPKCCGDCGEPLDAEGNCYPCFELAQEKRREEGE